MRNRICCASLFGQESLGELIAGSLGGGGNLHARWFLK